MRADKIWAKAIAVALWCAAVYAVFALIEWLWTGS